MSDRNRYRGAGGVEELAPAESRLDLNVLGDHGRRGTAGEDVAEQAEIKDLRTDVESAERPDVGIAAEHQEPSPVTDSSGQDPVSPMVRRVAKGLWLFFFIILPLSIIGFLIAVDPYYVIGSPSLRGFNTVRPDYESYVVVAKPYQVWRMRPEAVVLGASSPEVGIDPRHPGWGTKRAFNFSIPSSISYVTMLSFLHAQKLGVKQAVVSLDFFSFNINYSVSTDERRFVQEASAEFAHYLDETLPGRAKAVALRPEPKPEPEPEPNQDWNEALYLAINQDVTAAIARHQFASGRQHWELAGRAENRVTGPPEGWDEAGYLQANPDVAIAVANKQFLSGFHHYSVAGRAEKRVTGPPDGWDEAGYLQAYPEVAREVANKQLQSGFQHYVIAGRAEGRLAGLQPSTWNESGYLAANPDVRVLVALGLYRTGFIHYAGIGKRQGRLGGFQPANRVEKFRLQHPGFDKAMFNILEFAQLAFAMRDAVSTPFRQNEPAEFNELGMRVWQGHDEVMRKAGGWGTIFHNKLLQGGGDPWLPLPKMQHCFSNSETGMTTFDPFRFMLRRAYAEGTDLRMFTTPVHSAIYQMFDFAGLSPRYEQWLRELVRVNAEEAKRAGREPFPLWDFSSVNSITNEPIPARGDMPPMKYYWDPSHYSKATGDLILDRVLNYRDPSRPLPDDFGVRLDDANIDSQIAANRSRLAEWRGANAELASEIAAAARQPTALNRQAAASCW